MGTPAIPQSIVTFKVRAWTPYTDMKALETRVRNIRKEGLKWQASTLVSASDLEEEICEIEDLVQSVDIIAFAKVGFLLALQLYGKAD